MDRRVVSLCLCLSGMLLFAGCSSKRASSSEGDHVSKTGQSKSEEILPDAIKPIPPERSFDRPSGSRHPVSRCSPALFLPAIHWATYFSISTSFKSARMRCRYWMPMPVGFAPMVVRPC